MEQLPRTVYVNWNDNIILLSRCFEPFKVILNYKLCNKIGDSYLSLDHLILYTSTHTHIHTHTRTHTHTYTHTHMYTHSYTFSHAHSLVHSLTHSLTHSLVLSRLCIPYNVDTVHTCSIAVSSNQWNMTFVAHTCLWDFLVFICTYYP